MNDPKNLVKFGKLNESVPDAFKALVQFDEAVDKSGAILLKYKPLMAVADALLVLLRRPRAESQRSQRHRSAARGEHAHAGGAMAHGTHLRP